jgi:hypothetical protein
MSLIARCLSLGKRCDMSMEDVPLVLNNALRRLSDEARMEAALVPMTSPVHAFYAGVAAAAEDRLRPTRQDSHSTEWLNAEQPAFREGYLKASSVIATAGHAPVRLLLPNPSPDLVTDSDSEKRSGEG